jgi:hypothetical protein
MKTIEAVLILFFGMAVHCYAAGDAVSSLTKDENGETTTFRRDGKTILKCTLSHSTEPERRTLRQTVIFHDEMVLELVDFHGKRLFTTHPKPHVSVGITQDSSTGALENVGLMDDSHGILEDFEVKGSRLIPIPGKDLDFCRAITKDISGLLAPKSVKKTTPEEFRRHVKELVKKYNTEESPLREGKRSNDKPSPQDPPPGKKQP